MSEEQINNQNEKIEGNSNENRHQMRLSIDIHSIKDPEFRGLIYVRYSGIASLGIKQFKTLPAIEVLKTTEGL